MAERERRIGTIAVEARAEGEPRTLTGYAALYGAEARIGGLFREVIEPGAFRAALARKDDVRALWNHDPNHVLGRSTAGTLVLTEDERGLRVLHDSQRPQRHELVDELPVPPQFDALGRVQSLPRRKLAKVLILPTLVSCGYVAWAVAMALR